ncbi:hypothetical protein C2S52_008085 [Perilla frutescens var. hirtella]|nr:hypothetical protein C2S52_008085 [Perilla frutescens var. hirtella]
MLENHEGGIWFKKHFLVLLNFCLIESYRNSYVPSHILDYFEDMDRASDFNWCAHVLKCSIEHTTSWKENTNKYFTGPTLFITLVYVDRVVLGYRRVARSIPAILAWKDMMILRRQNMEIGKGGFGQGYCDGPCREKDVVGVVPRQMQQDNEGNANVNEGVPPVVEPVAGGDRNENDDEQVNPINADVIDDLSDMHAVAIGLLKQGKVISDALSTIMATVRKLPPGMLDNVAFRKTVEASMMVSRQDPVIHGESSSQPTPTQDGMDFWNNPEYIAAILEIEKTAMQREQLQKELCSMPIFSLGLTQEWDGIMNLARDAVELAEKETGMNTDVHNNPHRPKSSIMEDTSDVGCCNEDAMGMNTQDVENAGNVADITEKLSTVVDAPPTWNYEKRSTTFSDRLISEIYNVSGLQLDKIDMFFFTICHNFHFYLMCFDPKKLQGEIIDNSSALDGDSSDPLIKYGNAPNMMVC